MASPNAQISVLNDKDIDPSFDNWKFYFSDISQDTNVSHPTQHSEILFDVVESQRRQEPIFGKN